MACRICFESEGPLCTPCKCKGSIEHIHEACLLTWIGEDEDRSSCELCKEPYALDYNQPLERDKLSGPLRHYFLINPSWHIAAFCSTIIIAQQWLQLRPSKPLLVTIQLAYHMAYLCLWRLYIQTTIHDQRAYYHHIQRGYGRLTLYVHGTLLVLLLALSIDASITHVVLVNVINQCYLGAYPILHSSTVNEINRQRKIIIRNRERADDSPIPVKKN